MRTGILGIKISVLDQDATIQMLRDYNYSSTNYICLPDLSVLVAAQKDPDLRKILNDSLLTLPDGKYIEFMGRMKGISTLRTVSGYWLIRALLNSDLSHYFYGSDPVSMKSLINNIKADFPGARIAGYASPPVLRAEEIKDNILIEKDIQEINLLKPDIVWIGISSPKQDYLAYYFHKHLNHGLMIGVGGVFDYLAETRRKSPEWIKKIGFRWLYRLMHEPRRLWKKYFNTLTGFTQVIFKKGYSGIKSIFRKK